MEALTALTFYLIVLQMLTVEETQFSWSHSGCNMKQIVLSEFQGGTVWVTSLVINLTSHKCLRCIFRNYMPRLDMHSLMKGSSYLAMAQSNSSMLQFLPYPNILPQFLLQKT
ncbi:hypothetical protein O6P43_004814 [Quillaja saponaria]|uniref:Uncharacterized protein n=1 Tax=Quillaja saponaria TaxID=32244 RepID=A0AAD7VG97_QUISA|nr:hypothetical protein O6P43_004814 [Quillaja saponaria]